MYILLPLRSSSLTSDPISFCQVGNKLFVYISCCLAGAAYPCGELEPDVARRTKEAIVEYLTVSVPPHSRRGPFYCLRTLLHFNAREFLNVLSLAFEDERFEPVEDSKKIFRESVNLR